MNRKNAIAIGVFDGVHKGHCRILEETAWLADRTKGKSIVVTFDPHPASVFNPKNSAPSLISLKHRLKLMRESGIDKCVVFNFTKKFSKITPLAFIKNILVKKLNAGCVVVGEDFRFGANRQSGVEYLKLKGKEFGFVVKEIKTLKYKGYPVSSSLIRRSIQNGSLDFAGRLLGRPVTIMGTVVKGNMFGRKIGFPTANINPHHEVIPPTGVYAVRVKIDTKQHKGVLNIGTRPTFYGLYKNDKEPTIEVYIFNFSKNIYKKTAEVEFVKRLRKEKKFFHKEALIKQIKSDIISAKKILNNLKLKV